MNAKTFYRRSLNWTRALPAALLVACAAVLPQASAGDLDELEIDLPRPLGGKVLSRPLLTNEVEEAELSLHSGYRALLPRHRSPLVHGVMPLAGAGQKTEYDQTKVLAAKRLLAGRHLEAEVLIRKLRRQKFDDPDVRCLHATSCFYQKRFDEADRTLRALLLEDAEHPTGLFLQLCVQHMREEAPKPKFNWSLSGLMQTEMFVVWLDHSRVHLLRILSPEQFATICTTAIGKGSQDHLGGLRDSLSKARIAYTKGEFANALVFYDLARTHGLGSEALFVRTAECLFRLERYPEAFKRLDAMTREFPHNPHIWYNKGLVQMQLVKFGEASASFQKASEIAPRNGLFSFAHACSLVAQNQKENAWPILERVAREHPVMLREWVQGEDFYLADIRNDERFMKLPKPIAGKKP